MFAILERNKTGLYMVQVIDGKLYSDQLCERLREKIISLGVTPGLAIILAGNNEASRVYVASKIKRAKETGINILDFYYGEDVKETELLSKIDELNNNSKVNGILVQLPLPEGLSENKVINAIRTDKDVDGFTVQNIGLLNSWQECLEPSTPQGALMLIKSVLGDDLSGRKAVVLGRSLIVGRPMASILVRESCTVSLLHSKSLRIEEECRNADIIVTAIGKPGFVKAALVKKGACVIDIGITRVDGKLYGDADFNDVAKVAGSITPVPGGVGPMTVACMLSNTVRALCIQRGLKFD